MAYAIIKTGGKQYKVAEGDVINIEKLDADVNDSLTFDEVLLHVDGNKVTEGSPLVKGVTVKGKVLDQLKAKKVIAYKFRRRKGYHRMVGHRRQLTQIKIESITA